jgi:hypothetical protein
MIVRIVECGLEVIQGLENTRPVITRIALYKIRNYAGEEI